MMKRIINSSILLLLFVSVVQAQYRNPLDIPLLLSGNFGELRNNHFHSGIDLKTQGVVNKPVYSVEDGYISRIAKSPSGYGLALYITHPKTGQVSLYGHLDHFIPAVEAYVKEKQYEEESFRVNLFPEADRFPVKKGDLIAYSGNSGSSGGPHVHFEIRDAETEYILDPLQYYTDIITDKVAPELRGIAVYPVEGKGSVNKSRRPLRQGITKLKAGGYSALKTPVKAWGVIGLGVKAYDRMTGVGNIYGVKTIRLFVDDKNVFESTIGSFSFDQTRMLNSFVDFDDWRRDKSFYMKSFVEPGNKLEFYEAGKDGYITIDEERTYKIRYELMDIYNNKATYSFNITGEKQEISALKQGSLYMAWDQDNHYLNEDFSLIVPAGNLYSDFVFVLKWSASADYFSDIFSVNDEYVPFHDKAIMQVRLKNDTLSNKNQYGIVSIRNNKESWVGGTYVDGYLKTNIREIGQQFAVSFDDQNPEITPIQPEKWEKESAIRIKVTDNKSGLATVRGTIDGKFALFEPQANYPQHAKSPVYTYKFDPSRLIKGQTHELIFTATDGCGNTSEYRKEFYY